MRLLAGLCLVAASAVAAPQKPELPPGVIGRLGTASTPKKGEPRPGDVTALVYLGDNTLSVEGRFDRQNVMAPVDDDTDEWGVQVSFGQRVGIIH